MVKTWKYDIESDGETNENFSVAYTFTLTKKPKEYIEKLINRIDNYFDCEGLNNINDITDYSKDECNIEIYFNTDIFDDYYLAEKFAKNIGAQVVAYINTVNIK